MDKKTALVIGATGLVGSSLVDLLIENYEFDRILLFARRSTERKHEKIVEHVVDFDAPEKWKHLLKGDVLFSAMGTTIKKAKTKTNQYKIDYTYQYQTAANAAENGVKQYTLISSVGAKEHSNVFYSKMKGELDRDVKKLNFEQINIIQPSVLVGEREETRMGESVGIFIGNIVCLLPYFKKYKPIAGIIVAHAMINAVLDTKKGIFTYSLDQVFKLAKIRQGE